MLELLSVALSLLAMGAELLGLVALVAFSTFVTFVVPQLMTVATSFVPAYVLEVAMVVLVVALFRQAFLIARDWREQRLHQPG